MARRADELANGGATDGGTDDGSSDGTSEMLATSFPLVEIIKGDGNLWWGAATNKAIKSCLESKCDYVILLNDDCLLLETTLDQLVQRANEYPDTVICPVVTDVNNPAEVWWAGSSWGAHKYLPFFWLMRQRFKHRSPSTLLPKTPYSLGHKLTPILREYRRASSVAIDASLKPLMQDHLLNLEKDLRNAGYKGEFLISTSAGGCAQVKDIVERPIHAAKSGPAQAPVAARMFGNLEKAGTNYIVCDSGGTTFDVGLITNNELRYSRDTWLGGDWIGHIFYFYIN